MKREISSCCAGDQERRLYAMKDEELTICSRSVI